MDFKRNNSDALQRLELEQTKRLQADMLKYLADYCKEENIPYYLSNGTLLGAVKYGGFIPWDDDIDILVPRKDYDRLIAQYKESERYKLFCPERTPQFCYPYAKLCDMTTVKTERNLDNGISLGVEVDIFPLDAWAPSLEEAEKQVVKNKKITKQLGYVKTIHFVPSNRHGFAGRSLRKYGHRLYQMLHSPQHFCKEMMQEAVRYRDLQDPPYMGCVLWPVYGTSEILPAGIFAESVEVEFEGEKYPAPIGYDQYLRSLYGDYEQDPPAEKQVSHHHFEAYWRNLE